MILHQAVTRKEAALTGTLNGEQIKDDMHKLLHLFLGNASIPKPEPQILRLLFLNFVSLPVTLHLWYCGVV